MNTKRERGLKKEKERERKERGGERVQQKERDRSGCTYNTVIAFAFLLQTHVHALNCI